MSRACQLINYTKSFLGKISVILPICIMKKINLEVSALILTLLNQGSFQIFLHVEFKRSVKRDLILPQTNQNR